MSNSSSGTLGGYTLTTTKLCGMCLRVHAVGMPCAAAAPAIGPPVHPGQSGYLTLGYQQTVPYLHKYHDNVHCPKCRSADHTVRYVKEPLQYHVTPLEKLSLTCAKCSYTWDMAPCDREEPEESEGNL